MIKSPMAVLAVLSLVLIIPSAPVVLSNSVSPNSPFVFYPNIPAGSFPNQYSSSTNAPNQFLSANWAGYADNSGINTVTVAAGSWIQPAVTCNPKASNDQIAAFWVGIDGFTSLSVEQTGTSGVCFQGSSTPVYQAWFEFYPAVQKTYAKFVIHPGDVIQASVIYIAATHTFKTTLRDVTTGKSKTSSAVSTTDQRSSAECIAEAPAELINNQVVLLPLAKFTKAVFGNGNTGVTGSCFATINGVSQGMGAFSPGVYEITMVQQMHPGTHKATPSALTHQDSFSVTWNSAGP